MQDVCMGYRGQSPGKRLAKFRKGIRLPGTGVLGKVLALGAPELYSRETRSFHPQGKPTNQSVRHRCLGLLGEYLLQLRGYFQTPPTGKGSKFSHCLVGTGKNRDSCGV